MVDEQTNTLIAGWYSGSTIHGVSDARSFSDWAISKLEEGYDTGNLRMLASMFNEQVFLEVEGHFRRTLTELDWKIPERRECLDRYSRFVASEILEGKIAPVDGCWQLYDLNFSLDYPTYLSNWSGIYWAGEDLSRDDHETLIKEEAQNLLAGVLPDPQEFYRRIDSTIVGSQPEGLFSRLWRRLFG